MATWVQLENTPSSDFEVKFFSGSDADTYGFNLKNGVVDFLPASGGCSSFTCGSSHNWCFISHQQAVTSLTLFDTDTQRCTATLSAMPY